MPGSNLKFDAAIGSWVGPQLLDQARTAATGLVSDKAIVKAQKGR